MAQLSDYPDNFFETNELLSYLTGLWLCKSKDIPKWKKYLQILWMTIEYTTGTIFLVLQFLILNETSKDINKFFSHIGLLLSNALGAIKIALIIIRRSKFQQFMDALHDKNYQYESLDDFKPSLIFLKEKNFSKVCSISILCVFTLVGVSAHLSVARAIRQEINGTKFEGNHSCQDYVPYYFRIPFEVDTTAKCDYVLFFMDVSVCAFAWIVGCYDGFFVALLNCVKTHLVILKEAVITIKKRVIRRLDLDETLDIFRDEYLPVLEEELYNDFTHLVKHLNIILSVAEEIEKMFNLMILAQTLTSLFNVASCLFSAAREPVGSALFFATLTYFLSMLLEFALVCWFGSEITTASEQLMFAFYDIDWLSASQRLKKSLILTMSRLQRPIYLSIGKFFPLTLNATVSVCKASFSYYTVFRRVDE